MYYYIISISDKEKDKRNYQSKAMDFLIEKLRPLFKTLEHLQWLGEGFYAEKYYFQRGSELQPKEIELFKERFKKEGRILILKKLEEI